MLGVVNGKDCVHARELWMRCVCTTRALALVREHANGAGRHGPGTAQGKCQLVNISGTKSQYLYLRKTKTSQANRTSRVCPSRTLEKTASLSLPSPPSRLLTRSVLNEWSAQRGANPSTCA